MHTERLKENIKKLKENQLEAVNQIYGPVMVIAGPGTGKTQILSTRIGNILLKTDTDPKNILCLTYTEAAATEMRERLASFIGAVAHNINIHTFHGFCSRLISEFPEYFGDQLDLKPLDDIERLELFMDMIDTFPAEHELKRAKGRIYFEKDRMNELFSLMKKENWSPGFISEHIDRYLEELPSREGFYYKRGNRKRNIVAGDPNLSKIKKEMEKMDKLRAAANEYDNYNNLLLSQNRFDYQDMILWVINAFKKYPEFLQITRERFQFMLVDEYQDTSGAQNELLFGLCGPADDQPNVFVVGDEDQSIYKFQGANVDNILDFHDAFKSRMKLVFLKDNFRSSQDILSATRALIEHNKERINLEGVHDMKILKPAGDNILFEKGIKIASFESYYAEKTAVYKYIQTLIDQGSKPEEIAVLFRKNKEAEPLVKQFRAEKIPFQWRKRINVIQEPIIRKILEILTFVASELKQSFGGEPMLFTLLHFDLFGLQPLDLAKIAIKLRSDDKLWREVISDEVSMQEMGIRDPKSFLEVNDLLEYWIQSAASDTLQLLFEKIIYSGPVFNYIRSSGSSFQILSSINTFFEFIKERTDKDPALQLREFLELVEKMNEYSVSLNEIKLDQAEKGVQFITAHSSKGHQFDHVIIIGCNADKWEASRSANRKYKLPATLTDSTEERNIEEDRRLFYVAMTRARQSVLMTYSKFDHKGDETPQSRFLLEVEEANVHEIEKIRVDREEIEDFLLNQFAYSPGQNKKDIPAEVDEVIRGMRLNISAVNKYLRCPVAFYFENILRAPLARNAAAGFGNAVHFALEQFFKQNIIVQKENISSSDLLRFFKMGMQKYASHFTLKELEDLVTYGKDVLPIYYKHHIENWKMLTNSKTEHKISNAEISGIAVTGIFDRVDIKDNIMTVVDYKTGNPNYAFSKIKGPVVPDKEISELRDISDPELRDKMRLKIQGQDYWRQMVFYSLLAEADPWANWHFGQAIISFIEPDNQDRVVSRSVSVSPEDRKTVIRQLVGVYEDIQARKFEPGCNLPYCKWCELISNKD